MPDMKSPETFSSVIGNIAWLATMSPEHKTLPIEWLEKTVFPALLIQQFKLYSKNKQPMAVIVYGLLSDEHYSAWKETGELPHIDHWRSGSNVAVFECISPFAKSKAVLKEFAAGLPETATNKADFEV